MGFQAGDIDGTLTLDRTPFNLELRGAEQDAEKFERKRFTAKLGLVLDTDTAREDIRRFKRDLVRDDRSKIVFTFDRAKARKEFRDLAKDMNDAGSFAIKPTLDSTEFRNDVNLLLQQSSGRVRIDAAVGTIDRTSLDNIAGGRTSIAVDLNTAGLSGQVDALARQLRRVVVFNVGLDFDAAELAQLQAQLQSLQAMNANVRVTLDSGTILRDIARLHQQVSAMDGQTIRIRVDVDTGNSLAELTAIATILGQLDGGTTRHRVDIDTNSSVAALGRATMALLGFRSLAMAGIAIPGVLAAGAQIASLIGALGQASGAFAVLPGAILIAGSALAAFKVGMAGFSEALKVRGDAEKFAEAIKTLSPAAREAAIAIRDMGPAWKGLQLDVQEKLFANMGKTIQAVGNRYLPFMREGLVGIAGALNTGAQSFAKFLLSSEAVENVSFIMANTKKVIEGFAPALANIAEAFLEIGAVGSEVLAGYAGGAGKATAGFRDMIVEMRNTGQLESIMRRGFEVLGQIGALASNVGGILGGMFTAASAAGADFLGSAIQITGELEAIIKSGQGQLALTAAFREATQVINTLLPGVRDLATAVLTTVGAFAATSGLQTFAQYISDLASTISPLVAKIGQLAGESLGNLSAGFNIVLNAATPLIGAIGMVVDGLGPMIPLAIAAFGAFKAFGVIGGIFTAMGAAITGASAAVGLYATALTGSMAAGGLAASAAVGLGSAIGALGKALPVVGIAAVALGFAVKQMSVSTDDAAAAMLRGGQAADDMRASIAAQNGDLNSNVGWINSVNGAVNEWFNTNIFGIATIDSVNASIRQQVAAMSDLERAELNVTVRQNELTQAINTFGQDSAQADAAARRLASATDALELEQIAAENATDLHTAAMIRQSDQAQAATNASLGYEGALLNLEGAQRRATEAIEQYGASSYEAREAIFQVTQASVRAAEAAREKAVADAEATGATNSAEVGAQAYRDELNRLAGQASGPTRQALLDAAAAVEVQGSASRVAEELSRNHKTELQRLADQASGGTRTAIQNLISGFDSLGGAHATAQERARAQEDALRRLASTVQDPLRSQLTGMADQLRNMPDASFEVRATGRMAINTASGGLQEFAQGGIWDRPKKQKAATGMVLPGYTPGRDVHQFFSATGGQLDLSGGEAVMRPEWTQAVGKEWVNGANAAARRGGKLGVADFFQRTLGKPSEPGEYKDGGVLPHQSFAAGGTVTQLGIKPFPEIARRAYTAIRDQAVNHMTPLLQAELKKREAAAAAAAAAAAIGNTAGGNGWQWQMNVLRQRFPGLQLISGFRPGAITATGNPSYHGKGRAVDIPPRMDVFNWIKGTYGGSAREIIHSPANAGQINNGRPYSYPNPITRSMHWDHIHWAQKMGGILPDMKLADRGGLIPTGQGAMNLSGSAERMLSPKETESFEQLVKSLSARPGQNQSRSAEGLADAQARGQEAIIAKLQELLDMLERRGAGATINMQTGGNDPTANARAMVLALRTT